MNTNPTISVIIPAFDSAATIGAAIDSVLAQSVACHEIIVVDDGSAQALAPELARYGARVRCIRQQNLGAAAARNAGIESSTGELIAFLDADDTWEPEKLSIQLCALAEHPEVDLIASRYFEQSPGKSRAVCDCHAALLDRAIEARGEQLIDLAAAIWTGTVLLRRAALANQRFMPGVEPAEDRDLWLRLIHRHRAIILSDVLATAHLVCGSLSRRDPDSGYEPMLRVLRRHADLYSARARRRAEARVYRAWAGAHLFAGRPRRALPIAARRWLRNPLSPEAWWIVAKCLALAPGQSKFASETRSRESLQRHFEIERELATRLRTASAADRRALYGSVYNELFARVSDHPQNRRKQSADAQRAASRWQLRLLRHFVQRESRYLEIGAGDCHLAMDVAQISRWSFGLDVSNVISASAHQPANFSLIISDGVKIDLPTGSIDVAYSNQLMEHLHPDDAAAQLAEIRRTLSPGGSYLCITPHRFSGPHDISKFFTPAPSGFHLKEYTYAELRELFFSAGFASAQVWAGVKGHYFAVPTWAVLFVESALRTLPHSIRRFIARAPLMRSAFTNVLLVARTAAASSVVEECDPSEIAIQS